MISLAARAPCRLTRWPSKRFLRSSITASTASHTRYRFTRNTSLSLSSNVFLCRFVPDFILCISLFFFLRCRPVFHSMCFSFSCCFLGIKIPILNKSIETLYFSEFRKIFQASNMSSLHRMSSRMKIVSL